MASHKDSLFRMAMDMYYISTSGGETQHITEESEAMRKGGTVPSLCGEQVSVDGYSVVGRGETSPVCSQCQAFADAGDNGVAQTESKERTK